MRRIALLLAVFTLFSCASTKGARYSETSSFYKYQVHDIEIVKRYVYTPAVRKTIARMPVMLRPQDDDFLTVRGDLDGDGREDIVAAIKHYMFSNNGRYSLFVLLRTDDDFSLLKGVTYLPTLDVFVSESSTNGLKDIKAGTALLKYDGESYK